MTDSGRKIAKQFSAGLDAAEFTVIQYCPLKIGTWTDNLKLGYIKKKNKKVLI